MEVTKISNTLIAKKIKLAFLLKTIITLSWVIKNKYNKNMLLNFYLFCLSFILLILILSLFQKKPETVLRSLTLLGILHVLCLVLWQGALAFTIFVGCIFVLGLYELSANYQTNRILLSLVSVILFSIYLYNNNQQIIQLAVPLFLAISITTFINKQEDVKHTLYLFSFIACFMIPCSIFLVELFKINNGIIILIVLLLQLNDSFGYLFGKKFGKTRLFPAISPNKTLEGYLWGGVGIIIGIFLLHTYIPVIPSHTFSQDVILFVYSFTFANTGDLLLSCLKRKLEIKDFSHILPGHGGILDRFDNILFVAPVFYVLFVRNVI